MITFKRIISRVGKIALDVWPHAPHLLSCIARCRWIIICFILLYNISNELNYIILQMVARLLKKQLISLSVQILNGIVLSLLSLLLLSYFHWKLTVLVFLSVAIIINVIIIFLTWILLLSLKLTYIIVIIIIIIIIISIIIIIIDYYLSLLLSLSFFELIQMLCIAFLLNLEWSDWPPP